MQITEERNCGWSWGHILRPHSISEDFPAREGTHDCRCIPQCVKVYHWALEDRHACSNSASICSQNVDQTSVLHRGFEVDVFDILLRLTLIYRFTTPSDLSPRLRSGLQNSCILHVSSPSVLWGNCVWRTLASFVKRRPVHLVCHVVVCSLFPAF